MLLFRPQPPGRAALRERRGDTAHGADRAAESAGRDRRGLLARGAAVPGGPRLLRFLVLLLARHRHDTPPAPPPPPPPPPPSPPPPFFPRQGGVAHALAALLQHADADIRQQCARLGLQPSSSRRALDLPLTRSAPCLRTAHSSPLARWAAHSTRSPPRSSRRVRCRTRSRRSWRAVRRRMRAWLCSTRCSPTRPRRRDRRRRRLAGRLRSARRC